ncbi:transcriptional regulator [Bosea sp. (in: a-proteobacteria)]|uniref:transcriptional regulator n=1 Tax=Bosea sp. (in: a-proteobacteria) TaxID=1871050 RepID=UPI0026253B31|nr:transcriptional regulator [Bosea sp. (in: a-proteobacteria)]MCO5091001.1 transcriptional regulator [Bosea sp. (in: a-proteobacteria)]
MSGSRISPEEAQLRAQSKATLAAQRRADAQTALEALRAEQIAVRERTARLRALRLAKEAADAEAASASQTAPSSAKPAKSGARRRRISA